MSTVWRYVFDSPWRGSLLCLLALSIFSESPSAAEEAPPRLLMAVSANEVEEGEQVIVEVQVDLPKGQEIEEYIGPSSRLRLSSLEGKVVHSEYGDYARSLEPRTTTSYRYAIKASKVGDFSISPASIRYGDDTLRTNSLSILVRAKVKKQDRLNAASEMLSPSFTLPKGGPDVLIHAFSDKKQVWVGERIEVSWLLFAKTELIKYEPTPPSLDGLWSESLFEPSAYFDYSDKKLANGRYVVSLLSKRALYATQSGELSIAALSAKIATLRTALGRYDQVSSNVLQIRVDALPSPVPEGFDPSYVGRFSVDASADRREMPAGQPFTLSLKVKGHGAMGRLSAPRLEVQGYSIEEISDGSENETSAAGQRLFRYWVVPERSGEQVFPAVVLHYFDSASGAYKLARSKSIALKVGRRERPQENEKELILESEKTDSVTAKPDNHVDLLSMLYWLGLAIASSLFLWGLFLVIGRKKH